MVSHASNDFRFYQICRKYLNASCVIISFMVEDKAAHSGKLITGLIIRSLTIGRNCWTLKYEACSEIIETTTISSKRLNIIQNSLHSHHVLHIWGIGLNYLTASFNDYDPVAFLRLIPPLHRSTSHNVGVHCIISSIYYRLNEHATINSFASKVYS